MVAVVPEIDVDSSLVWLGMAVCNPWVRSAAVGPASSALSTAFSPRPSGSPMSRVRGTSRPLVPAR